MGIRLLASSLMALAFASSVAMASPKSYDVKIDGMTCANCVMMIKDALSKIPGIDSKTLKVTLKKKEAVFTASDDKNMNEQIKTAIETAGYTVKMINGQKMAAAGATSAAETKKN